MIATVLGFLFCVGALVIVVLMALGYVLRALELVYRLFGGRTR